MWCIRGALSKAKKVLINKRVTKGALECALSEARHKGRDDRTKHKAAVARQSLLKAQLAVEGASASQTRISVLWDVCLGTKSYLS